MPSFKPEPNVVTTAPRSYFVEGGFIAKAHGFERFFEAIGKCLARVECTGAWAPGPDLDGPGPDRSGVLRFTPEQKQSRRLHSSLSRFKREAHARHRKGKKVIFMGNGGSAAISQHMAVDWTKNGPLRSVCYADTPTITCFANDHGFGNAYAKILEHYSQPGDLVVIISSSGKSPNVLAAGRAADALELDSVRLTGMNPDNELRRGGRLNLYVPSGDYGLVELTHLCLLHSIVSVSA